MKISLAIALLGSGIMFVSACHSTKNSAKNKEAFRQSLLKKQDPVAAEAAVKAGNKLEKLSNDLAAIPNNQIETIRTAEGVNITFEPAMFFDSNTDGLSAENKTSLDKVANILSQYSLAEIFVEGHADSSGNQLKNKKLSELRAKSVAVYLKTQGVRADRIAIAGYAATKPLVSNATPEGRKRNRRVIIKIRAKEQLEDAAVSSRQ